MSQLDRLKQLTVLIGVSGHESPQHAEYLEIYHWDLNDAEREYADIYSESICNGCSAKLADMFASKSPPMSNTDREFLEGHCNGSQFAGMERMGDSLKMIAESEGQVVKGKVYLGSLARYPGDPEAWVEGRGDVKRVIEKRGWGVDGAVSVAPRDVGRLPHRKARPWSLAARLHGAGLPIASS